VILTHEPPLTIPQGQSQLVFATEGVEAAVVKATGLAKNKDVGIAGASVAQQALRAGLVDEPFLHVAPLVLGQGVRLFEHLGDEAIRLHKMSSLDSGHATHLRFEALRQ
jgi:dihydrofolate reductase